MIYKIFKLIIFIILIWLLSEFFSNTEGTTNINWMGWGLELPTDTFVFILIIFSSFIIFIDRIWLAILNLPKSAMRKFEISNNKKVEEKLVKAFLLASHGEYASAAKEAALISKNTKDKKLGKLLDAHLDVVNNVNSLSENKKELSQNYFKALTDEPSTAFVGHLALMRQALLGKKNIKLIIDEGEKALKFEPKSKQTLEVLLVSYAKIGDISNSLIHLNKMKNLKYINVEKYKNISADLNYLSALSYLDNNKNKIAVKHFKEALKQKPNHIPASIKLTDVMLGIGSKTKSINYLEKTFLLTSNPDVLDQLSTKWGLKTSGSRVSKAISLLNKSSLDKIKDNLKIEIACYAIKEEIWGEADKLLSGILEENLTQKGYQAFADIAGSQNKPDKVKDFLKKAANAVEDLNYFCSSCGSKNNKWDLHCPNCESLSTIQWIKRSDLDKRDDLPQINSNNVLDKSLISY